MYKRFIKTALDFVIALVAFVMLIPLFVLVTIGLFFANQRKPFFFQIRPGKNGKLFKIIKFKTMNDKKDAFDNLLPDSKRLTKTGNFIRKTSLDEIPQLLNVLKGEMSLVGPRPLLVAYLSLYSTEQAKRHNVRPGITGWAQVNGRNAIPWDEKFKLDVWYVKNQSFLLDLKILLLTLKKVFVREGISSSDSVTMSKFKGN
tara:strand:- start:1667 stop:2269 length:603 start_codon:yes stop_codon:yes gene_type:complete